MGQGHRPLAFQEGLLAEQPRVELLPEDDARPIVPPSDTELHAILNEARAPALLEVARHLFAVRCLQHAVPMADCRRRGSCSA
jgi:hypothetical protein